MSWGLTRAGKKPLALLIPELVKRNKQGNQGSLSAVIPIEASNIFRLYTLRESSFHTLPYSTAENADASSRNFTSSTKLYT